MTGTSGEVDRLSRADPGRRQRALGPPGAAGRLLRRRLGRDRSSPRATSSRATSTRPSTPPRRSATTASRSRPAGESTPTASPTAPPSSAAAGSSAATSSGDPADCDTFRSRTLAPAGRSESSPGSHPSHRRRHRTRSGGSGRSRLLREHPVDAVADGVHRLRAERVDGRDDVGERRARRGAGGRRSPRPPVAPASSGVSAGIALVLPGRRDHRRADERHRDRREADAVAERLGLDGVGERLEGGLGGDVAGEPRRPQSARRRRRR